MSSDRGHLLTVFMLVLVQSGQRVMECTRAWFCVGVICSRKEDCVALPDATSEDLQNVMCSHGHEPDRCSCHKTTVSESGNEHCSVFLMYHSHHMMEPLPLAMALASQRQTKVSTSSRKLLV